MTIFPRSLRRSIAVVFAILAAARLLFATALASLSWTYNAATDVPVSANGYTASGNATLALNFVPTVGTNLTVVKNTALSFISGTFSNLAQGQQIILSYNGIAYTFMANYYGGTGNDLVLQWANSVPMSWGSNTNGQLGNNGTTNSLVPVPVSNTGVLAGKTVIGMAGGGSHSLAFCSDGTLAAWGLNNDGQLGNNSTTNSSVPVAVSTSGVLAGKKIIAVAAGTSHSVALCSDGTVAAWGDNPYGALGNNSTTNSSVPVVVNTSGVLAGKTVVAIAAGAYHCLGLCSDGTVAAWGYNGDGELGNNSAANSSVPVAVNTSGVLAGKTVTVVAAGNYHNLVLCSDGTLAAWGANFLGQLGNNSTTSSLLPVAVSKSGVLAAKTIIALAGGGSQSLALCSDGTVAAWGNDGDGELGNNSTTSSSVPVLVNTSGVLAGKPVVTLVAGEGHGLALCSDGTAVGWGYDGDGELGNNNTADSLVPALVTSTGLANGARFVTVSAGQAASHSFALVVLPEVPTVTTLAASSISSPGATLNGTINAWNNSTAVSFDYGLTTAYGTNVAGTPSPVTGSTTTSVSASLPGLTIGTTYHFRVNGASAAGTSHGSDATFTPLSNNANLSNVALSSGTLSPTFASATTSYSASVSVNSITVTPTVAEPHASATVNGMPVSSGSASAAIPLNIGANTITTVVTAQDGVTTKTYTVAVTSSAFGWTYNSAADVPVTAIGYSATGAATLALNFAPTSGTTLTLVNNTGSGPINGTFSDLAQGQQVVLPYNGMNYTFTASYNGGTGNDLVLQWAAPPVAQAPVYEQVFSFTDARIVSSSTGHDPACTLVQTVDGYFYGTTRGGGAAGAGTIFRMSPAGTTTTLVEFTANGPINSGANPNGLVLGSDGNLYGTTARGGPSAYGTIFRMTPEGTLTTLVQLTGTSGSYKGASPEAALLLGSDGNLYGSTRTGGASNDGTIFKMTLSGAFTTLVEFTGSGATNQGANPYGCLIQGYDGNFYGTTFSGGSTNNGTVFKMTNAGILTTLVNFMGSGSTNDGSGPLTGVIQGTDGNFYGTTAFGGSGFVAGNQSTGNGTIFKMTPAGSLITLEEFPGSGATNFGTNPYSGLLEGNDGNLYGTTRYGGTGSGGTVFKVTMGGQLTTLAQFNVGTASGASLSLGSDGNFYGTTEGGGPFNAGTVFMMTPAGAVTTLAQFTDDGTSHIGKDPQANLIQDNNGYLYSTTSLGGEWNSGTVFKFTPGGILATLAEFNINAFGAGGGMPVSKLVLGNDSNFYGTTELGGIGYGTIFKMTPSGAVTMLVAFTGNSGSNKGLAPQSGLVQGSDGNFYGTTAQGGAPGYGTIFKVTSSGALTTLVEFTGTSGSARGAQPLGDLLQGSDGNFYGTTSDQGTSGYGTVFKMTPSGVPTTLVQFTGTSGSARGALPMAGLVQGVDGNFYGTTFQGGASISGTIFKMTPSGTLTTLVDFTGSGATNEGSFPSGGLVQGSDGNFYGTTSHGGAPGYGTAFKMTPGGLLTTLVEFDASVVSGPLAGLMQAADGCLYGTTYGPDGSIFRLIFPGSPLLAVGTPVSQSTSSSVVQATINARGETTAIYLDYGTDGVNFPNTNTVSLNQNGYTTQLVGGTLGGLTPGTIYYYRFRAVSILGTTVTQTSTFSPLAPPTAAVTAAANVTSTSAQLNGTVNAENYPTTVTFQYGTDGNTFLGSAPAVPATVTGATNTMVSANVPVSGGNTYYYRIQATNAAGTTISGVSSFYAPIQPVVTNGPASFVTTTSATLSGTVNALGTSTTAVFYYGTDGATFPFSAPVSMPVTGNTNTAVTAQLTGLTQTTTYYYELVATNAGGSVPSAVGTFTTNVRSDFSQVFPGPPPDAQGVVIVNLTPTNILSGWRFVGENIWRQSGVPALGLTTGDREIEYRPVPGYQQPLGELVPVTSGGAATVLTEQYAQLVGSPAYGQLTVVIQPAALAASTVVQAQRAQWRFVGDGNPSDPNDLTTSATWRDTSTVLSNLFPGNYLVECKPVAGRTTPRTLSVNVQAGQATVVTATYLLADATVGTPPSVLPGATVASSQPLPYAFVGQIRSDLGSATGFIVEEGVVATAGHVVFDDGSLNYVTGLTWSFQRDKNNYEPVPLPPAGIYTFTSYSARRQAENNPGVESANSQNVDVAALFFLIDSGRDGGWTAFGGGYSGYLASDSVDNEFLESSALKVLVGYPVDGIAASNQGRMFATTPANITFSRVLGTDSDSGKAYALYTTTQITSYGGNSGGPLCVQFNGGAWYPAGIYLGGAALTTVRSIDSDVIGLFQKAELAAQGGPPSTGGGVTYTQATSSQQIANTGFLAITISGDGGYGRWQVDGVGSYTTTPALEARMAVVGSRIISFTTVSGYVAPAPVSILVKVNQTANYQAVYTQSYASWSTANLGGVPAQNATATASARGDGVANQLKYTFNMNPTEAGSHPLDTTYPAGGGMPVVQRAGTGANARLTITYLQNTAGLQPPPPTGGSGLQYFPEFSSDLHTWTAGTIVTTTDIDGMGTWQVITAQDPMTGPTKRYARVRVVLF